VICSKDTPSSLWVDKEIATFRKLGKGDHIIPVLVEGTPETSFPPSLLTLKKPVKQADGTVVESDEPLEPIAADVRERKDEKLSTLKRLSLLRILSAILGCAFDDLRQRDQQRQIRKKRILYSVAAALALLIVGGSLYLWDYNRVKVSYYNTIVYRWGVPEGVGRLTSSELGHKAVSYQIKKRQGRVIRAIRSNNAGKLRDDTNGESEWLPSYRSDGTVEKLEVRDHNRRVAYVKKYSFIFSPGHTRPDSALVEFAADNLNPFHRGMQKMDGTVVGLVGVKSSVTRLMYCFDDQGLVKAVNHQNIYGVPKPDIEGRYGIRYEHEGRGLITGEAGLDAEGKPFPSINGHTWSRLVYDDRGCVICLQYTDAAGAPVSMKPGYTQQAHRYDRYGNLVQSDFLDAKGQPAIGDSGFSRVTFENDERGNPRLISYYGTDEKEMLNAKGYSRVAFEYDGDGNPVRQSILGLGGSPVSVGGVANYSMKYDSVGNQMEKAAYGLKNEPVVEKGGAFAELFAYDAKGNTIEIKYQGTDRKMLISDRLPCRVAMSYNNMNLVESIEMYITDTLSKQGEKLSGSIAVSYDERGNCTDLKFMSPGSGYYMHMRFQHDDMGNYLGVAYLDTGGRPAMGPDGMSSATMTYDKKGNLVKTACFGLSGGAVDNSFGFSTMEIKYDDRGIAVDTLNYNARGKLVNPKIKNLPF